MIANPQCSYLFRVRYLHGWSCRSGGDIDITGSSTLLLVLRHEVAGSCAGPIVDGRSLICYLDTSMLKMIPQGMRPGNETCSDACCGARHTSAGRGLRKY